MFIFIFIKKYYFYSNSIFMNINKSSKIKLYKENILKFISTQSEKNLNLNKISELDFLIGILFLTEMNRYCKNNKISIHGYYIASSLINLFSKIKSKLLSSGNLSYQDTVDFYLSLANNVDYLNNRVDPTNQVRNKINFNLSKLMIELNPLFNILHNYKKKHNGSNSDLTYSCSNLSISSIGNANSNDNINQTKNKNTSNTINPESDNLIDCENKDNELAESVSSTISHNIKVKKNKKSYFKNYCDIKCYNCWVENILVTFFYILLMTAKFMGSGEYKDPNLKKLAEYYSNIFFIYLKVNSESITDDKYLFELFDNYIEYKNKLNYSLIELKINSDTVDEIINYLDNIIIKKLSINKK